MDAGYLNAQKKIMVKRSECAANVKQKFRLCKCFIKIYSLTCIFTAP